MPSIVLKDFKGQNPNENNWGAGFAKYVKGIDIYGLSDNPGLESTPGVIQGSRATSAMDEAASPSAVTSTIKKFVKYSGKDWCIDDNTAGRLLRNDSATWGWVSAINVSGTGAGLETFNDNLYYFTNTNAGEYDNTNGNANFNAFTGTSTTGPRPSVVFAGNMYVGHSRFIAKFDSVTWTAQKLTLPSNFDVVSLEVYQDRIMISADNGQYSRVFIWDGNTTTFEDSIVLFDESTAPSIISDGGLLWLVANRGASAPAPTPVYVYDGASLVQPFVLPIERTTDNGLAIYQSGILIGSSNASNISIFEDGVGGVWYVGKRTEEDTYYAVLLFEPSDTTTDMRTSAVYSSGATVYIGAESDITGSRPFEIYTLYTTLPSSTNNNGVWQSLSIDAGDPSNNKVWNDVELDIEDTVSSTKSVTVSYRLDYESSFTTIKAITSSANRFRRYRIGKTSKVIELKVELASAAQGVSTRVHSITLNYDNATN